MANGNNVGDWNDWCDVNVEMTPCNDKTWDAYLVKTSLVTKSQPKGAMFVAIYHDYNFEIIDREFANNKIAHWTKLPQQPNILRNENK